MQNAVSYDKLVEKWAPVLNEESAGTIQDAHRKAVTAAVLENQEIALKEEQSLTEITQAANVANWNPVLIALVRRAMPNLVAYDICGVQPMTGPTGLIFAMKSTFQKTKAGVSSGDEALFNEAPVGYSGDSATTGNGSLGPSGLAGTLDGDNDSTIIDSESTHVPVIGDAYTTAEAEVLGTGSSPTETIADMGFTIEKATVTAKSRALKANYTLELAQDLKAIHGLDAETELANILSTEILSEINREVVRTVNRQAKIGSRQASNQTLGIFDLATDADGRWSVEKYKGLIMQIERESNVIAKETRRGKGNFILCSSDVAAALNAAGMLDYTPALSANLNVDDTGNTFAGVLNGRTRVYIDPFSTRDYINVGYKGTNPYDAGLFYCPYVPLTMVKAVGEEDFQPRIGFKTRYGMVSNPFVGTTPANGLANDRTNQYYRITAINNILS
jgi:hypothetical protein